MPSNHKKEAITDYGEIIPNANKHNYCKKNAPSTSSFKSLDTKNVELTAIWPKPNYKILMECGHSKQGALHVVLLYQNLRRSPKNRGLGFSNEQWQRAFVESIEYLKKLCADYRNTASMEGLRKSFESRFVKRDQNKKIISSQSLSAFASSRGEGRKIKMPFSFNLRTNILIKVAVELGWPEKEKVLAIKHFPMELEDGNWVLAKARSKSLYFNKENEFKSKAAAITKLIEIEKLDQTLDKLVKKENVFKAEKPPVLCQSLNAERHSSDFIDTFGFRGIQFGNWLSNSERQLWLDNVFQAFELLAKILGIPKKWIGLGGLGIAFGARGRSNAMAHYESELNVINLTKLKGPGSIAHEWFHGVDYRLGKNLMVEDFASRRISQLRHSSEKIKAMDKLWEVMASKGNTNYFNQARRLDAQKGARKYWGNREELFARAFESYVQDKLSAGTISSPWLVSGTLKHDYGDHISMHPYPLGKERLDINMAMDNFIKCLFELDRE